MVARNSRISSRVLLGALAGIGGTIAMTAAMRRLERRLPRPERYPMPPRELVQQTLPDQAQRSLSEVGRRDLTLAAHFGYGAFTGALLALAPRPPTALAGAGYGVLVWTVSYLGWIPALRILRPATRHPTGRNAAMIAVHLLWGAVTAVSLRELDQGRHELFMHGPSEDAPKDSGRRRL